MILDQNKVLRLHQMAKSRPGTSGFSRDDLAAIHMAVVVLGALDRSGYDVSVCMDCGAPVVCIPDGMPMCEPCAVKVQGPRMQYRHVTHEDIGKQIEVTAGSITDPDCEWVIRTLVSIEEIDKFSRRYVCLLEDGLQSYEHYEEARIKVPK